MADRPGVAEAMLSARRAESIARSLTHSAQRAHPNMHATGHFSQLADADDGGWPESAGQPPVRRPEHFYGNAAVASSLDAIRQRSTHIRSAATYYADTAWSGSASEQHMATHYFDAARAPARMSPSQRAESAARSCDSAHAAVSRMDDVLAGPGGPDEPRASPTRSRWSRMRRRDSVRSSGQSSVSDYTAPLSATLRLGLARGT